MRNILMGAAAFALIGLTLPAVADNDGWEKGSEYNKKFDPKTIVTISGKVSKIDRDNHPLKTMEAGFAATIKTDKGEEYLVQVGPIWFTSYFKRKWDVKVGDAVEVTGSKVNIGGNTVIMAMKGRKGNLAMTCRNKTGKPLWDLDVEDF